LVLPVLRDKEAAARGIALMEQIQPQAAAGQGRAFFLLVEVSVLVADQ
jgi:hypothetical protein